MTWAVEHPQERNRVISDETARALRTLMEDTINKFSRTASSALQEVRRADNDHDALLAILNAMHTAIKVHMQHRSNGDTLLSLDDD